MAHTLLLADDSVTIQRVIELTFADEDVRVVAVGDGDQAIAAMDRTPPDIVLADVGMPGKNGYEVAEHIRHTPRLAHIPVVLLTGAFEPIDQAKAKEVGCDGVLAKPFEPQLVISRVKELLARPKPAAIPEAAAAPPWAAIFDEPTIMRGPLVPAADTAQYFDKLDAAFADLGSASAAEPSGAQNPPPAEADWFNAPPPPAPASDLPLSYTPPQVASFPTPQSPVEPAPPPSPPPAFPPLADAFAALLAAEQSSPLPAIPPAWPAPAFSAQPAAPAEITRELVDEIANRVLETLSDRVVRETVAGIVSAVAERLVREEIERLKNSIK